MKLLEKGIPKAELDPLPKSDGLSKLFSFSTPKTCIYCSSKVEIESDEDLVKLDSRTEERVRTNFDGHRIAWWQCPGCERFNRLIALTDLNFSTAMTGFIRKLGDLFDKKGLKP